jgi:hypothetical protein
MDRRLSETATHLMLDLADLEIDLIAPQWGARPGLETLENVHGGTEMNASSIIEGVVSCSCCPCCCCC